MEILEDKEERMIEYENEQDDWILRSILFFLAIVSVALFLLHRMSWERNDVPKDVLTTDMEREATIDSYESPDEVVEYVLYWISQGDLDLAMRGCAIEEAAECFSLQAYTEITGRVDGTQMFGPADEGRDLYQTINRMRMTSICSDMIEQCISLMGDGQYVRILNIDAEIPEDADGYYYKPVRNISTILNAREIREVVIDLEIDDMLHRMTMTTIRYGDDWKVLLFNPYKKYDAAEPALEPVMGTAQESSLPYEWEEMSEHVLPLNYEILCDNSEESVEELLQKWYMYIRRDEVAKALTYFDIYDSRMGIYPDSLLFARQADAAQQVQDALYKLFLYNADSLNWIRQNPATEAENLIRLLETKYLFNSEMEVLEILEEREDYVKCKIRFRTAGWKQYEVELVYRDGWKIKSVV